MSGALGVVLEHHFTRLCDGRLLLRLSAKRELLYTAVSDACSVNYSCLLWNKVNFNIIVSSSASILSFRYT